MEQDRSNVGEIKLNFDLNKYVNKLMLKTIEYFSGDPKRINHFVKVFNYAKLIGENENLNEFQTAALQLSAIVHDCGIKISEEKYNSSAGKYQELEGPAAAEELLSDLGLDGVLVERIKYLVGHHHTYNMVDGPDYQILLEADFIVNAYEDGLSKQAIKSGRDNIFKTKTGTAILNYMFL